MTTKDSGEGGWVEEFDTKFTLFKEIETLHRPGSMHERFIVTGREKINTKYIKSFISSLLLSERAKILDEVVGMVEEGRIPRDRLKRVVDGVTYTNQDFIGYNLALSDLLAKLAEVKSIIEKMR